MSEEKKNKLSVMTERDISNLEKVRNLIHRLRNGGISSTKYYQLGELVRDIRIETGLEIKY